MIKHVVCFKIKEEYKNRIEEASKTLKSMEQHIPYLISVKVGIDFLHSARSYDIILEVEVESVDDLNRYQQDPYHVSKVKTLMHAIRETSVAVDYYE